MVSLAEQRCLNHALREAVARCPECRQFFCRECVTEHDDRALCAACLKKLTKSVAERRFLFANFAMAGKVFVGVLTIWIFFYAVGRNLLAIPDSFHEGTVWRSLLFNEP